MKVPLAIVCVLLTAVMAGEAWTVASIMDLKVGLARIEARFEARIARTP